MYSKFCTLTYCERFKVIVIKIFKTIPSIEYCIGNGIGWFATSTTEPVMRERENSTLKKIMDTVLNNKKEARGFISHVA